VSMHTSHTSSVLLCFTLVAAASASAAAAAVICSTCWALVLSCHLMQHRAGLQWALCCAMMSQ
jgi:hypothetical protein